MDCKMRGKMGDKLNVQIDVRDARLRSLKPITVLDHGVVRLVDYMGSDLSIVRAARVSYDAAWRAGNNEANDEKLLRRLYRDKHSTPFETVTLTFEVKAPIFVARQWHRHRTWTYNELSARYRELPAQFYVPDAAQVGKQATKNKQGREAVEHDEESARRLGKELQALTSHCQEAFAVYCRLLEAGWPRELARGVLPLNTYTHMFATVNLGNLFKFINERCDPHAQWEIRQYAWALFTLAREVAPIACDAWLTGFSDKETTGG